MIKKEKQPNTLFILCSFVLLFFGCESLGFKKSSNLQNQNANMVVLKGKLSLPTPERYQNILLNDDLIIFSLPEKNIGYGVFDREDLAFIGSSKSPYNFFNDAFADSNEEEEKKFLEGFGEIKFKLFESTKDFEFYFFDLGIRKKIYILSNSLDFVAEVTSEDDNLENLFRRIIQYSNIQ